MISSRGSVLSLVFGVSRAVTLILKIWRSMPGGVDIYTPGGADTLEELKSYVHPISNGGFAFIC